MSGTLDMVKKYGGWFDYDKHPRAQIFKRDHVKVNNMDDMLALMRYNDFKHDPLSQCDCQPPYSAENAISARNDLNMANGAQFLFQQFEKLIFIILYLNINFRYISILCPELQIPWSD